MDELLTKARGLLGFGALWGLVASLGFLILALLGVLGDLGGTSNMIVFMGLTGMMAMLAGTLFGAGLVWLVKDREETTLPAVPSITLGALGGLIAAAALGVMMNGFSADALRVLEVTPIFALIGATLAGLTVAVERFGGGELPSPVERDLIAGSNPLEQDLASVGETAERVQVD